MIDDVHEIPRQLRPIFPGLFGAGVQSLHDIDVGVRILLTGIMVCVFISDCAMKVVVDAVLLHAGLADPCSRGEDGKWVTVDSRLGDFLTGYASDEQRLPEAVRAREFGLH